MTSDLQPGRLRGVNLGGWLVLEKWMKPSLFQGLAATDETSWCAELGPEAGPRLRAHWDSWITRADFQRYPRTLRADSDLLAAAGADLLFAPEAGEMYGPAFATHVVVEGQAAEGLEADHRPGFFAGVATVVAKLLLQAMPDRAYFGEKDYQQLLVIRRMAADLDLAASIEGCTTVRDADGLALSSRNAFLAPSDRRIAPQLFKRLGEAAAAVHVGAALRDACRAARDGLLADGFAAVDYLEVRDAATLAAPGAGKARPLRILAAARLGETRLIDNVPAAS
ncbi:MAG: pantoate--beta-alanine ligase [Proteobacteria bacterium]|nr:pantoate--beta-alanine ligase [Pseudomonadota bacterium]